MTGFRRLTAADPAEEALRDHWYATREKAESGEPSDKHAHWLADKALSEFLWRRANTIVAKDRAKHPKAARNLPVGALGKGGDRILP